MIMWFTLMCMTTLPQLKTIGVVLNLPTCFFLSEISHIWKSWNYEKKRWLSFVVITVIIATILLYFTSHNYYEKGIVGGIAIVEEELIKKYFFLIYGLVCVVGKVSIKTLLKVTYIGILLLTFFGILDLVLGHPVFLQMIYQGRELTNSQENILGSMRAFEERYRVHSMFTYPFDYGFICVISSILALFGKDNHLISKGRFWIIMICALLGVVMCACRTVFVCAFLALFIYIIQGYSAKKRRIVIFSLSAVLIVAFFLIPQFQEMVYLTLSAFQTDSDVSGSNVEMRQEQYLVALLYAKSNLFLGNGKGFFDYDLGHLEGGSAFIGSDLNGLEGVLMNIILERGILGVLVYLSFYFTLLICIYKLRKVDRSASACCISILLAYLIYANMTGELGSVPPTLFIVGALLSVIIKQESHFISRNQYGKSKQIIDNSCNPCLQG